MTNEERAREAVEKILIDLSDRSGMNLLDQIRWDDPELWKEIIGDGSSIILAALDAATAPLVAERERLRGLLATAADDLDEARQLIASWGSYASDYFQEKHDLSGDLATLHDKIEAIHSALAEKEPG